MQFINEMLKFLKKIKSNDIDKLIVNIKKYYKIKLKANENKTKIYKFNFRLQFFTVF